MGPKQPSARPGLQVIFAAAIAAAALSLIGVGCGGGQSETVETASDGTQPVDDQGAALADRGENQTVSDPEPTPTSTPAPSPTPRPTATPAPPEPGSELAPFGPGVVRVGDFDVGVIDIRELETAFVRKSFGVYETEEPIPDGLRAYVVHIGSIENVSEGPRQPTLNPQLLRAGTTELPERSDPDGEMYDCRVPENANLEHVLLPGQRWVGKWEACSVVVEEADLHRMAFSIPTGVPGGESRVYVDLRAAPGEPVPTAPLDGRIGTATIAIHTATETHTVTAAYCESNGRVTGGIQPEGVSFGVAAQDRSGLAELHLRIDDRYGAVALRPNEWPVNVFETEVELEADEGGATSTASVAIDCGGTVDDTTAFEATVDDSSSEPLAPATGDGTPEAPYSPGIITITDWAIGVRHASVATEADLAELGLGTSSGIDTAYVVQVEIESIENITDSEAGFVGFVVGVHNDSGERPDMSLINALPACESLLPLDEVNIAPKQFEPGEVDNRTRRYCTWSLGVPDLSRVGLILNDEPFPRDGAVIDFGTP